MKNNQRGFSTVEILIVLVIVGLIGVVGWLVYDKQQSKKSNEEPSQATSQSPPKEATAQDEQKEAKLSYQGQKVTSGRERFTVEIPQGWNELLRPMDSNWLFMKEGTAQPKYSAGKPVKVTDVPSFGGDGPRVFSIFVHDNIANPEGTPSNFTLPNNGQPIQGTKYSITYSDTVEGMDGHKKGEKSYEYRFNLKDGNSLVIWYRVYSDDLNDQSSLVDEIVSTIVVKN